MANRYWVGGTNTWNSTAGTKWASSSGGAGGASVPTSSDSVFFDANSGSGTVECTLSSYHGAISFSGFTGTIKGILNSSSFTFTLVSSMSVDSAMTLQLFNITLANPLNVTLAGKAFNTIVAQVGTPGIPTARGQINFLDDVTATTELAFYSANITENSIINFSGNVTAGKISFGASSSSRAYWVIMNNGTYILTGEGTVWGDIPNGLAIEAGSSTIKLTNNSSNLKTFQGGFTTISEVTYNNIWNNTQGEGKVLIIGENTFNNIKIDSGRTQQFYRGSTTICTTFNGSGATLESDSAGVQYTLEIAGGGSILDYFTRVTDSIASPTNKWESSNPSSNGGNNTGWRFNNTGILQLFV